jgi:hypothetical protein
MEKSFAGGVTREAPSLKHEDKKQETCGHEDTNNDESTEADSDHACKIPQKMHKVGHVGAGRLDDQFDRSGKMHDHHAQIDDKERNDDPEAIIGGIEHHASRIGYLNDGLEIKIRDDKIAGEEYSCYKDEEPQSVKAPRQSQKDLVFTGTEFVFTVIDMIDHLFSSNVEFPCPLTKEVGHESAPVIRDRCRSFPDPHTGRL